MSINKNMNIFLPIYDSDNKDCQLFQCYLCGIHSKVFSICTSDEDHQAIKLLNIYPEGTNTIYFGGNLLTDSVVSESLYCGICLSAGSLVDIDKEFLESLKMIKKAETDYIDGLHIDTLREIIYN
jgi:hypothetical protein